MSDMDVRRKVNVPESHQLVGCGGGYISARWDNSDYNHQVWITLEIYNKYKTAEHNPEWGEYSL